MMVRLEDDRFRNALYAHCSMTDILLRTDDSKVQCSQHCQHVALGLRS